MYKMGSKTIFTFDKIISFFKNLQFNYLISENILWILKSEILRNYR